MITDNISDIPYRYKYLAVDSRSVADPANTLFAAIRTSLGDGHKYISELYNRGVRGFLVDSLPEDAPADAEFIITDDVEKSLRELSYARIRGNEGGIIVTGSHGKTTMKELLYRALQPLCDVACSPRSWNSRIGVSLALWNMTAESRRHEHMITEAGIDGPGQGLLLREMLRNSHHMAIVTPLSREHDEAFKSHADKLLEKIEIIKGCSTVIYADSDPEFGEMLNKELPAGTRIVAVKQGTHPDIYHALADAAMAEMGYTEAERAGIDSLPLTVKRREISEGAFGNIILRDYFTPDLRSLADALDFMRRQATPLKERVLVLGRLLACKCDENGIYDRAARTAALYGVDRVINLQSDEYPTSLIEDYQQGRLLNNCQILLFGTDEGAFKAFAETLEAAGHDTTLEVDLDAIAANYNYYRSLVPAGTGIVAMVKASAYGMGAIEIGKTMQSLGAAYLAVAVIEEGIALRSAGITMPVMVLNPVTNRYPALFGHNLEPAVFSPEELDRLISEAEKAGVRDYPVHIKLDTGMHRVGFLENQLAGIAERLSRTDAVKVKSVFSHLATADCLDMDSYTRGQLELFFRMTAQLRHALGYDIMRHILNTAGMMRFADCGSYEMGRLGIGLYGVSPYDGPEKEHLHTVASFRSHIISLKHWPAGTPIGYGCKGVTKEADAIIATVPVGYADGVNRRLGNGHTSFVIRGRECPTIGNICMDLCMVDVSGVPDVAVGDSVEIFGTAMPVERVADALGTIPYEVFTSVSQRVKRVYIKK